ncbi:hypothetical protein MPRS_02920 [Mycobacterium paraseoulense]|nr:hypothetical protein MPRS_02920 [Mycobacterium paraseoulense]
MVTFTAVPVYDAAILAEVPFDDRTQPAPNAAINVPMRGWLTAWFATASSKYRRGAGDVSATYDLTAMAPVVSPLAVPTGAFPR